MMEFTLSRTVMFLCGAVLVTALVLPLGEVTDTDTDRRISELAQSEA